MQVAFVERSSAREWWRTAIDFLSMSSKHRQPAPSKTDLAASDNRIWAFKATASKLINVQIQGCELGGLPCWALLFVRAGTSACLYAEVIECDVHGLSHGYGNVPATAQRYSSRRASLIEASLSDASHEADLTAQCYAAGTARTRLDRCHCIHTWIMHLFVNNSQFWYLHCLSAHTSNVCESFTVIGRGTSQIWRRKVPETNKWIKKTSAVNHKTSRCNQLSRIQYRTMTECWQDIKELHAFAIRYPK